MSAWTGFRDGIIDSLKFDEVIEELKEHFSGWLVENVLPLTHTAANSFIVQTKAQAAAVINLGLWVTEKALAKTNISAN